MTNVTGGPTLEELAPDVPELIARWCGWHRGGDTDAAKPSGNLPQSERLLRYSEEDAELFHDPDGFAYATVEVDGHWETHPIKSSRFKDWLVTRFYRDRHRAPNDRAMTDALNTIRAKAIFDGPEVEVFIRIAGHEGDIYIDLCNESWEAIKITCEDWTIVQNPPVRFIRKRGMAPLPYPERGGSVDDMKPFLNLGTEEGFRLLVAWAVFSLTPWGPYVILVLQGEQGSAKSTTVRVVRALVDPAVEPLRALPRDERDMATAANNAWVLAVDNLSGISDRLSDALCRLATDGGFATRELYTDDEEMVFSAKRPIILNGIDDIATRGDLQERSLLLSLPSIPQHERQEEKTFWADFDAARPMLFGALLDAVSGGLQHAGDVRLDEKPRMADFAIWGTAVERALGWEPGAFIRAYTGNREEANEALLDNEPVVEAIQKLLKDYDTRDGWSGTATMLLFALGVHADEDLKRSRAWPKAPNALIRRMRRIAPALRSIGIEYSEDEEGNSKRKVKTLRKIDLTGSRDEENSQKMNPP